MTRSQAFHWILVVALAALPAAPATAQICDGISPVAGTPLTSVRVASGLSLPSLALSPPGDLDRLFILEQAGTIRILKNGALLSAPFLDVSALTTSVANGGGNEEGLLGLAFHPDYATNGWFFIYHTELGGQNNLVVRYTRSAADPDLADPASRQIALTIPHPSNKNHNGGMIGFSPLDGYLYIGTGDGGSGCDPPGNAQNGSVLLGKMLRIDVSSLPYAIPEDNPFSGPDGILDEIWALGLRNPWRWSFDDNGDLYIADVGQRTWEEIDFQSAGSSGGENYGWDKYEGNSCPVLFCSGTGCTLPEHVPPVSEYNHNVGCSISGGFVYRGCRMPDLHGTYFYADFCSAFVASFRMAGGSATQPDDWTAELQPGGGLSINEVTAFGRDGRGEIYIVDRGTGNPAAVGGELFMMVPEFTAVEASGGGAVPFGPAGGTTWSWEDLTATLPYGIAGYRVYRSAGRGDGLFDCVHQQAGTTWDVFDPTVPPAGGILSYLVTAVDGAGTETSPGESTSGVPRSLSALACP